MMARSSNGIICMVQLKSTTNKAIISESLTLRLASFEKDQMQDDG